MNNLKVLLICVKSYSGGILEALKKQGANPYFIPDKPKESFFIKMFGRFLPFLSSHYLSKYYSREITKISKLTSIDSVLIVRGEYTPRKAIKLIKKTYPAAKIQLYMWDSLKNCKSVKRKWDLFDKVWTFDRLDYLKHSNRLNFLPLFYYGDYVKKIEEEPKMRTISFVGTIQEDRYRIINQVCNQLSKKGYKCFTYYYLPHVFIYYAKKIFTNKLAGLKKKDVHFNTLPIHDTYSVYGSSECVIDVESIKQTGLTMRTIEMLGLKKKLITTNKDIVNYDFYNESNILIIDRKKPVVDFAFFEKPYVELDEEIYKNYSLTNWLQIILNS